MKVRNSDYFRFFTKVELSPKRKKFIHAKTLYEHENIATQENMCEHNILLLTIHTKIVL